LADPEEVCRRLVLRQYWKDVMEALGESIKLAHQHGPDRWGIRLTTDSIMLKVGSHEVLQIGDWDLPFHLIVDRSAVPAQLRGHSELWFSEDDDYEGALDAKGFYRSNPGSEACNMPFEMVRYAYQELFNSHAEIISRAARKSRHPSTRATHSAELVQFVAEELGRTLPQPMYWVVEDDSHPPLIAEELPSDELFTEGAARQILVNAYERDRRARQLCIEHYGARCFTCGLSFEERYGPEAAGIIHVHHIIPLSEIGESYQVDPIKDLCPVCPNCHAVIHATKPPRTIEQVAKMVRGG
jgi:5-methylcytosine-specific restriction protein A